MHLTDNSVAGDAAEAASDLTGGQTVQPELLQRFYAFVGPTHFRQPSVRNGASPGADLHLVSKHRPRDGDPQHTVTRLILDTIGAFSSVHRIKMLSGYVADPGLVACGGGKGHIRLMRDMPNAAVIPPLPRDYHGVNWAGFRTLYLKDGHLQPSTTGA